MFTFEKGGEVVQENQEPRVIGGGRQNPGRQLPWEEVRAVTGGW